jgi:hypothetical protein
MKEHAVTPLYNASRVLAAIKILIGVVIFYMFIYGAYFYYTVYDGMEIAEEAFGLNEKYTMRINTFRRNKDLKVIVEHYSHCPNINSIQIIWSDLENSPPDISFFNLKESHTPVIFEVHSINSLNNRFNPLQQLETETVYSTDDDVLVTCEVMTMAFKIFLNSKAPMLGFSRRLHGRDPSTGRHHYLYKEHISVKGAYSMILTKNAFMDTSLMSLFMDKSLQLLHTYIDDHRNCEDVLMSFVAANATHRPSIYMYTNVQDLGKTGGISSAGTHKEVRDHCLDHFVSFFGYDPLITTSYDVMPVERHYLKLPGFWI